MDKLLIILGPTATGKTDLAINVAKKINGEIVSADSRQVYKGLDIGTGKMPGKEATFERHDGYWIIDGVKVSLYDLCDQKKRYDVWQYVKDAKKVIERISSEDKLPIIVGGTGLYIKALLEGFPEMEIPIDLGGRHELEMLTLEELQQKLEVLEPKLFQELNNSERNNKRRLVRKIEKIIMQKVMKDEPRDLGIGPQYKVMQIGLYADRKTLYNRIDERVIKRVRSGMIEEAKSLHEGGLSFERMRELGLEYRFLADFLEGKISSEEEFISMLQFKIHQYAKRQLTWFKRNEDITWFEITSGNFKAQVEEKILNWYNNLKL